MTHQPAHENGKVIVKSGFHVTLDAEVPRGRGKAHGYFKHGFPLETKEWLLENVGTTNGQHFWENEGKGEWLHTGSTQKSSKDRSPKPLLAHFWFRDRRLAALFVLTWTGRL